MRRRIPLSSPAIVAAAFLCGSPGADAQTCDCSCEAFSEFQSAMENQGGGQFSPAMQKAAACYSQCMPRWTQCAREARASAGRDRDDDAGRQDCDTQPNSPVERRKWREACGKPTGDAYWVGRLGEAREDLGRFYGTYEGPGLGWVAAPAEASMLDGERYTRTADQGEAGKRCGEARQDAPLPTGQLTPVPPMPQ